MVRLLTAVISIVFCTQVCAQESLSVFGDTFPEVGASQKIVTRHLYVACVDVEAKQPAWVAFRVQKQDWDTGNQLVRNFNTPAELRAICLESSDYRDSDYEMGHLYAIQFVPARQDGHEVNQLCAIAAQTRIVNRGPWREAEARIKVASETETVTVIAGQLWIDPMPPLPQANESHKIASHQWIMWKTSQTDEAYLIPQSLKRSEPLKNFRISREELQGRVSTRWMSP